VRINTAASLWRFFLERCSAGSSADAASRSVSIRSFPRLRRDPVAARARPRSAPQMTFKKAALRRAAQGQPGVQALSRPLRQGGSACDGRHGTLAPRQTARHPFEPGYRFVGCLRL
jgi:hypothetical protein